MNQAVISTEVDEYLRAHLEDDAASFMLKKHPFDNISNKELTQQLVGLQKAKAKFPSLFNNPKIIYPPKVNLEQTSSEITAQYKSQLYPCGNMIDLTGGFGIDVSAFAKACPATTHIELNSSLQKHALQLFKAQNLATKSYSNDGIKYLQKSTESFDLIFIDPSRKTASQSKAILLKDYEPNIIEHLDLLLDKGKIVMIKTSPMLDLSVGFKELGLVNAVHVVAVKNEVKELLWILTKGQVSEQEVHCVNLNTDQPIFITQWSRESVSHYSKPKKYLYEPNAAIMKSQQFVDLMKAYQISKLDHDAHLFTCDNLIDFPGRVFEIKNTMEYKPKLIKRHFGKTARGIVTRNNKETVAQLRKKYQFKEHETDYLFFTSSEELGAIVIEAIKLKL